MTETEAREHAAEQPGGGGGGDAAGGTAPRTRAAIVFGVLVAWTLLVAFSVAAWTWTGVLQRGEVNRGFDQRTRVAADFTAAYLAGITVRQQQNAQRYLAGRVVTQHEFELFGAGVGYEITGLFDGRGRIMLTNPPAPGFTGRDVTTTQEHIRRAVRENVTVVSNVYVSPVLGQSLISIATPYETPYGRRIFSGGFVVAHSPLGSYLREVASSSGGRAYFAGGRGSVVAASNPAAPELTRLSETEPELTLALRENPEGDYRRAGRTWRYASAPVTGTEWRLISTVPERRLYADVRETQRDFGVVLLVLALLGLAAALFLGTTAYHRRQAEWRLRRLNRQYARQAEELRAANAELDSFSSSVAHDLRAPLRAMRGYSEILVDDYAEQVPEDAADLLRRVQANATKMSDLIDALLSFSRVQRREMRTAVVDLTEVARTAWEDLEPQREGREIDFRLADLPPCRGDGELLGQVLVNLLSNAIKFTRERDVAHIEVGGAPGPPGYVTYYVRDDGVGFDPSGAERLFQPFQRLHRASDYPGVGIGLSLAQRIVTRHTGRIHAESTPGEGEGTTFTFTLPSA